MIYNLNVRKKPIYLIQINSIGSQGEEVVYDAFHALLCKVVAKYIRIIWVILPNVNEGGAQMFKFEHMKYSSYV